MSSLTTSVLVRPVREQYSSRSSSSLSSTRKSSLVFAIVLYVFLPYNNRMAYKAFRTKLKLDNKQATLMAKHAGYARFVFNWGLRLWSQAYKEGLKPSVQVLKKVFTNYVKPQFTWMSKLSSKVYQYAFINLGDAFKRFFKKLGEYPKFKKKGRHDSFTIDNSGAPIKLGGIRHKLPFIGWVSTHEVLPDCVVKKVTISRQAGCWYISFAVEVPEA